MVINIVKLAVIRNRPGFLRKGVIIPHDKACPHTAQVTSQTINKLAWKDLPHRPYSPDVVPSDLYLFCPIQTLKVQSFMITTRSKKLS